MDNQVLRSFFSVLRKLLQNLKGCVDLIGIFCCSDIFPFVLSNSSRVCNGCWCHENFENACFLTVANKSKLYYGIPPELDLGVVIEEENEEEEDKEKPKVSTGTF